MTTCSCGGGCPTYGACLRKKNLRIGYCQSARGLDYTWQKKNEAECESYRQARSEGIQPGGTSSAAVAYAKKQSDHFGKAFDAARPLNHVPDDGW